jgi:tRNA(Ile)-lysidine synthase
MLSTIQILQEFINKNALFNVNDNILLAVSGGKDSVVMAHLFHKAGYKFGIAHCNFHLRGEESLRDEAFVKELAQKFNLPFHSVSFDTVAFAEEKKISIQMAARDLRYNFFEEIRTRFKYKKIAVAQHKNDAMETVLLNLIRGTGIAGLHGIKLQRDHIIRPLLCLGREEIEQIIEKNNIQYVEDSSNSVTKYVRNNIRLKIIPAMKSINPSLEDTFQKNISYFTDLEIFTKQQIAKYRENLFEEKENHIEISIEKLKNISSLKFVLSELLMPLGFNLTSVQDLINALDNGSGKKFFSENYMLIIDRNFLLIHQKEITSIKTLLIEENTKEVIFNKFSIIQRQQDRKEELNFSNLNKAYLDRRLLIYPLTLRNWQEGDKFYPLGLNGVKKLSDYFINKKISIADKQHIPILINGDGNIIWIAGYRLDERFKITDETEKIITFELKKL